jgi:hypothetical protein
VIRTADPADQETVGRVAEAFIKDELDTERARKASLESRGAAVITSSGALVTLLFAIAAVVTKNEHLTLPCPARWLLGFAAGFFVVAAGVGIYTNAPARYLQVDPQSLNSLLDAEEFGKTDPDARRELTMARLAELANARDRNQFKAQMVVTAMIFQVLAVLLTVVAVLVLIAG